MIEYIQNEERKVYLRGVEPSNMYFLYVAYSFNPYIEQVCSGIHNNTKTTGGAIDTKTLHYFLEKRLRNGYKFVIENIPKLFDNWEIHKKDIYGVFPEKDELKS